MTTPSEDTQALLAQAELCGAYRIQSRWPSWAHWRLVTPIPHGERHPFDCKGLAFSTLVEAQAACDRMAEVNEGDFRVILPCGCLAINRDICTHGGHSQLS